MKQYDFSPLQKTPGKIVFPIIFKKTMFHKVIIYFLVSLSWIIAGAIIFFPLSDMINGGFDFGLLMIIGIIGMPIVFGSSYISYTLFKKGSIINEQIEIFEDRMIIISPKISEQTIFFHDITTFNWRMRHIIEAPVSIQIKTNQGATIRLTGFTLNFRDFMRKNFQEKRDFFS